METSAISGNSGTSLRPGQNCHRHVPKVFALSDTTPENREESHTNQQLSTAMIQLVRQGEGKDRMVLSNFLARDDNSKNGKELSLHRPILVRDTPESIGMKVPQGRNKSPKNNKEPISKIESPRKRKRSESSSETANSVPFSIRDVAGAVGGSSPVQVINSLTQQIDPDLSDWTFLDLVEYFEDKERLARNKAVITEKSPLSVSPTTGRSRRKAAIRSEECTSAIIHDEKSSGEASTRILNQISYEFSGTPLHSKVQSPKIVRDIDWIDQAWPDERKPRHDKKNNHKNNQSKTRNNSTTKTSKKASKGENSVEYPAVQYYCLTSAAGSYTDFHIDFGGSSVWYHVVWGKKIFVVTPPTRHNLRVYEEWLCHPDQEKIFLPDLMKERACPDIHCYSTSDIFSSASSVSTYSSASTAATYASSVALGDLADEMAFFRNSLQNTLSTNNALRFTLNAGETLILPAGWIHAVYTPVDSLVFGGNFLHGMDMQMQLTVNALEARSKVLDQYRFPHFGALQMYAGGMYLKRLRSMKKHEVKPNSGEKNDNRIGCTENLSESLEGGKGEQNQDNFASNTGVSQRELEQLPMLMNALEFWWLSQQDSEENSNEIEKAEKKTDLYNSRSLDSITSHASFRDAAKYVTEQSGCQTVEAFIATFRNEYARVSSEEWGSCRVAPSEDPTGEFTSKLSIPLSSIPIAIGKPKDKTHSGVSKKRKGKPRHKRIRKGVSDLDDPLDVVLSKKVKDYLASIQITTAAQFLLARTTDIAKGLPEWRKKMGMPALKGETGAVASVSTWKRKVRLRAAMVGANKLAQLNEGTNMKPLKRDLEDDRKPSPTKTDAK